MFKVAASIKNKQPLIIKERLQRYLKNRKEPTDNPSHDSLQKDETVLVENSPLMRQRFRGIAHRMRIIRIDKNKRNS
jgi:hypothetical protein